EALFDHGRHIAAVGAEPDREAVHDAPIGEEAQSRDRAAGQEHERDLACADQIEGVEAIENNEKDHDGRKGDKRLNEQVRIHHMIFNESSTSSLEVSPSSKPLA